ncbi:hypothetical protein ACIOV9_24480, partial [Pseudomonas iridis]
MSKSVRLVKDHDVQGFVLRCTVTRG